MQGCDGMGDRYAFLVRLSCDLRSCGTALFAERYHFAYFFLSRHSQLRIRERWGAFKFRVAMVHNKIVA